MPQAAAAFVFTFVTQLVTGAKLAVAFRAAIVVAALTQAASVIFRPDPPAPIELAERKTNIRLPAPARHIVVGDAVVGATIVDIRVFQDDSRSDILPHESRQLCEVHISPYRDNRHAINGTTATDNAFPVVRQPGIGAGFGWPISSRASLQASGNLVDEWSVYYSNRARTNRDDGAVRRGELKQFEILYAIADNEVTVSHLFLGNEQIDGEPGVDSNGLGTVRGDIYIRRRDHDGDTSTILNRAQDELADLDANFGSARALGLAAAFLWDGSGEGTFQDIVAPRGRVGATSFGSDEQFVNPVVFVNYGAWGGYDHNTPFTNRTNAGEYVRGATDIMGSGVSLLAGSYFHFAKNTNIMWPSIPELTIEARGSIPDSTWTEIRRIINDDTIYNTLAHNNTACWLYHYVLTYTEYGTSVLGGHRIDEPSVRQAIIDCDTQQLTARGRIDLTSRPDDVMQQFALAMRAGDVYEVGGVLHFIIGKAVAATHTITEDDVLPDWGLVGGNPRDQRPDAMNVTYTTLDGVGTDTVTLTPTLIRGEGSGITEDIALAYVGNQDQALDVATIRLLQAQESQALNIRVRAALGRIVPNETVMVDLPVLFGEGAAPKKFRVLSVLPQPELSLQLVLREERDGIWGGHSLIESGGFLLLETGDYVLLQDGSRVALQ